MSTSRMFVTAVLVVFCLNHDLPTSRAAQEDVPVAINELMASNTGAYGFVDPQGEFEDWIELHNQGDAPIDVGGMYLTDDSLALTKWQIPSDDSALTTIPAHGYLVIWADGDTADAGLHAAFRLAASGEEVVLVDRDGTTILDSTVFGQQTSDISYGRFPDGSGGWAQMTFPTPGGPNINIYQGAVDEPEISPDHGFFDGEFLVTVTCPTEGALIYYTVDGSDPWAAERQVPSRSAGLYTEPLHIGKTTCLRVIASKSGWRPSSIETRTYIFVDDVIMQSPHGQAPGSGWPSTNVNGQYIDYGMDPDVVNDPRYSDLVDDALLAIPSFSLVTDLANLFDSQKGIYVNAESYGRAWERPVSVELIYPDGTEGFQVDAGMRIRGGYSRIDPNPKHAFRLFFRAEYGMSKLRYPLFGDEGVDEFENIDLRTSQNYSWAYDGSSSNTFVRDVFSRDTQRDMGQPYTRSRYCHLYINGRYWGLFQTQERPEASYAETYFGDDKDDYDVIKAAGRNAGYTIEATDGTMDVCRELWEAATAGFDDDTRLYRVLGLNPDGTPNPNYPKLVDADNLIDYMLCTFYVGDFDGPISNFLGNNRANNFYAIYNRRNPDGFKWFRHDAEHSLIDRNRWGLDRTGPYTHPNLARFNYFTPQWLQQQLLEHPEFRMRLADRAHKHFFNEGVLTYEESKDRLLARAEQIQLAIIAESARWGDSKRSSPYTKVHWEDEVTRIVNNYGDFGLPNRTQIVLNQLRSKGWYPNVSAPTFSQHGGHVPADFSLEMFASGDIYYTLDGSDPRLPERAGGSAAATYALVAESTAKRAFVPTDDISAAWKGGEPFDDSSWTLVTGSPGGVGYERTTGYEPFISLDVGDEMYLGSTSCYVRIPFNVSGNLSRYASMVLNVRYDDGFVAYLNGVEIQRVLVSELTPPWDATAEGNHEADGLEPFYVSEHLSQLRQGENILAIHAVNYSTSSSDFIISAELEVSEGMATQGGGISPNAVRYTGPVTLGETADVKARVLSGNTWSALNEAIFAVGPVAESLRISEVMYHPAEAGDPNDPNTEYIELTNIGPEAVNLNLVRLVNGVNFTFPRLKLVPGDYCLVVKDVAAFQAKYGFDPNVAGQYAGSLNNAGERIELQDAAGQTIHSFRFRDAWYDITDGLGFSLTVKDPITADPNALGDKSVWRPSAHIDGSPGYDDSADVPTLGAVVINELLANSEGNRPDWIELHNTTAHTIGVGGWFLSDNAGELMRYEIVGGTSIPAGGYVVLYEDLHFGNEDDPGCHEPFALSRDGETVYLHSGSEGVLGGYSEQERYDASDPSVTLGRYKKSTGAYNFVALSEPTPGAANAYPQVGPVVINEIMYHPNEPADAEYVELLNISNVAVTLYDAVRDVPWRFTDDPDNPGIEFLFPADQPVVLMPGEYLVLTKNLDAFNAAYGPPADVAVFAWAVGNLANGSEKVQLSKPGNEDADGRRCWIRVDRVVYSDGSRPEDFPGGIDPWPPAADGQGSSLSRIEPSSYGNDPINWQAASPSPGTANP